MIKSFKHEGLKCFFEDNDKKKIFPKHAQKLKLILDSLDAATKIKDINFPGSRLHLLNPKKNKIWALDVSGNWRVIFKFIDNNVYVVDYTDYH